MLRRLRALAVLPLLAGLGACATAARPALRAADLAGEPGVGDDASVYGLYLAGRTALDSGSPNTAAGYLDAASARAPDAPQLKTQAFLAALLAGDVQRAASLAPAVPPGHDADGDFALGQLTRAVAAMAEGRDREALGLLSAGQMGDHWAAAALVRPWAAAGAGETAAAVQPITPAQDRAVQAFGQLNTARLLERAGRIEAAEAAYKTESDRSGVFTLAYGAFLERRGRRGEALDLYARSLAKDPFDPAFTAARRRAAAGAAAPAQPSIRTGAAEALIGPAAVLLAQKQPEAGLAYLRLALALDPELAEGWVLLGDALEADHDLPAAMQAYTHVKPDSPEYGAARGRLAIDLQEAERKDEALAEARALVAARPNDPHSLLVLADLYRDDERYPEAVATLNQLLPMVDAKTADSWRLRYLRGSSLERQGRWREAEGDLQAALREKPDDAEVLNYLGFAWADRGEHLDEAVRLLQKATTLEPDSGAYVDSLGWAYYREGRYAQAVAELERAASLDPADPDINSHLGDAYWRTGRRLEAQYQWKRVLTLQPDPPTRVAAEAKLAHGLPAGDALAQRSATP